MARSFNGIVWLQRSHVPCRRVHL